MMKMTGKAFAKKLFGAKYERLPRTLFVRPRACLPIWSFSCSEKWNIGKQINHLLCGWLELLQLTVKTSNVIIMLVCQPH